MDFWLRLRIGRLALAFAAVLIITTTVSALGVWRLGTLRDTSHAIATVELQRSLLAQRWASQIAINWVRASAALKTATKPISMPCRKTWRPRPRPSATTRSSSKA